MSERPLLFRFRHGAWGVMQVETTRSWIIGAHGGQPLRLGRVAPQRPDRPVEIVLFDSGRKVIGRLRFRVCAECRTGRILDIWISDPWQREGLGREALHTLLSQHPGHQWSTTLQSRPGRAFFTVMSQETQTDFPSAGPRCPHLRGWARRLARRVIGRFVSA